MNVLSTAKVEACKPGKLDKHDKVCFIAALVTGTLDKAVKMVGQEPVFPYLLPVLDALRVPGKILAGVVT